MSGVESRDERAPNVPRGRENDEVVLALIRGEWMSHWDAMLTAACIAPFVPKAALEAALRERDEAFNGLGVRLNDAERDREAAESQLAKLQEAALDLRPFPMQGGPPIPWFLAELIHRHLYRFSQPVGRIAERGGFGWEEVEALSNKNATQDQRTACRVEAREAMARAVLSTPTAEKEGRDG